MPRAVGLAYASVLYRQLDSLKAFPNSRAMATRSRLPRSAMPPPPRDCSGRALNAIGVLQAPAIITVFDDGYGISVPNQFQMVKENIHDILEGFRRDDCLEPDCLRGYDLLQVRGWDYEALIEIYQHAEQQARGQHIPVLVHVTELTQPQGHSTSGSHERYKTPERLQWEAEFDCIRKMREWMLIKGLTSEAEIAAYEQEDRETVEGLRKAAWDAYLRPILEERGQVMDILDEMAGSSHHAEELRQIRDGLGGLACAVSTGSCTPPRTPACACSGMRTCRPSRSWLHGRPNRTRSTRSGMARICTPAGRCWCQKPSPPIPMAHRSVNGFEVINAAFDSILDRDPRVIAFGEDVGRLGDVNQGFKGLQEKYGEWRVTDTGIREATILGQAIGMAMRGLRPICEIQYLDYLLYALQIMSDDLATLHWRTAGGQSAPVIVRTRGHRLEGIWHSGSLMAGLAGFAAGNVRARASRHDARRRLLQCASTGR